MACKDCGEKKGRYAPKAAGQNVEKSNPFEEAKQLSYEELAKMRDDLRNAHKSKSAREFEGMTEAMKVIFVEDLVSVANYQEVSPVGMSPDQAVMSLEHILQRDDFSFVDEKFPNLRESVKKRMAKLREVPLVLR